MEATSILKEIIRKGGVIGSCGKLYVCDEALATKYIIECSNQLHSESVRKLWGESLVKQIAHYGQNH
jgi:hypothetical protein